MSAGRVSQVSPFHEVQMDPDVDIATLCSYLCALRRRRTRKKEKGKCRGALRLQPPPANQGPDVPDYCSWLGSNPNRGTGRVPRSTHRRAIHSEYSSESCRSTQAIALGLGELLRCKVPGWDRTRSFISIEHH